MRAAIRLRSEAGELAAARRAAGELRRQLRQVQPEVGAVRRRGVAGLEALVVRVDEALPLLGERLHAEARHAGVDAGAGAGVAAENARRVTALADVEVADALVEAGDRARRLEAT